MGGGGKSSTLGPESEAVGLWRVARAAEWRVRDSMGLRGEVGPREGIESVRESLRAGWKPEEFVSRGGRDGTAGCEGEARLWLTTSLGLVELSDCFVGA